MEDAGLYRDNQFRDYLAQYQAKDLRMALKMLFEALDTSKSDRDPYISDEPLPENNFSRLVQNIVIKNKNNDSSNNSKNTNNDKNK